MGNSNKSRDFCPHCCSCPCCCHCPKGSRGPQGPAGARGLRGPQGATGPRGLPGPPPNPCWTAMASPLVQLILKNFKEAEEPQVLV